MRSLERNERKCMLFKTQYIVNHKKALYKINTEDKLSVLKSIELSDCC